MSGMISFTPYGPALLHRTGEDALAEIVSGKAISGVATVLRIAFMIPHPI